MQNHSETLEYGGYHIFIDKGIYYKGFITCPEGHLLDTGGQALTREACIKQCIGMVEWRNSRIKDTVRAMVERIELERS